MKRKRARFTALSTAFALLTALTGGALSPTTAVCQEEGGEDDVEECTGTITLDDGWLCVHDLECETLKADKLCFKISRPG